MPYCWVCISFCGKVGSSDFVWSLEDPSGCISRDENSYSRIQVEYEKDLKYHQGERKKDDF